MSSCRASNSGSATGGSRGDVSEKCKGEAQSLQNNEQDKRTHCRIMVVPITHHAPALEVGLLALDGLAGKLLCPSSNLEGGQLATLLRADGSKLNGKAVTLYVASAWVSNKTGDAMTQT